MQYLIPCKEQGNYRRIAFLISLVNFSFSIVSESYYQLTNDFFTMLGSVLILKMAIKMRQIAVKQGK